MICSVLDCNRFICSGRDVCREHHLSQLFAEKRGPSCLVDGCPKSVQARGYCNAHYKKLLRYGNPLMGEGKGRPGVKRPIKPTEGYINNHGYKLIRNNEGKWILEHRHVMEEVLGRPLYSDERVHHKDGNRINNAPENLELWLHSQPSGQRVEDLVAWAKKILSRYQ